MTAPINHWAQATGQVWTGDAWVERAVRLVLPWPPSVNHLWRRVGNKTVKSAEGRAYDEAVGARVKIALGSTWLLAPPYRVSLRLYAPDRRRYDCDNRAKAPLDGIWRALGQDDFTIDELHIYRAAVDKTNARCEVVIEEIGNHA